MDFSDSQTPPGLPRAMQADTRQQPPPFATGGDPKWELRQTSTGLILEMDGKPPVQFGEGRWMTTPRGRQMIAVSRDGRSLTLTVIHALSDGGNRAILGFAGYHLLGCLLAKGNRPYPGR